MALYGKKSRSIMCCDQQKILPQSSYMSSKIRCDADSLAAGKSISGLGIAPSQTHTNHHEPRIRGRIRPGSRAKLGGRLLAMKVIRDNRSSFARRGGRMRPPLRDLL